MNQSNMEKSEKYVGWSELDLRRQFWYLTDLLNGSDDPVYSSSLQTERLDITDKLIERGNIKEGQPLSKDGCEDLIYDADELFELRVGDKVWINADVTASLLWVVREPQIIKSIEEVGVDNGLAIFNLEFVRSVPLIVTNLMVIPYKPR